MNDNTNINNRTFLTALTGVVLVVLTMGYAIANRDSMADFSAETILTCLMATSAIGLLAKAIREDRSRNHDRDQLGQF